MIFVLFLLLPVSSPLFTHGYTCTHAHTHTQCGELEEYLTTKGAKFGPNPDEDLSKRLLPILKQCGIVFQSSDIPQSGHCSAFPSPYVRIDAVEIRHEV